MENEDYEPFGPEWETEMMKMSKKQLIQFIQDTRKMHSEEVEKAFSEGYESATKEAQQEIAKNMREQGNYWVKRQIIWHGPPEKYEIVWEVALWEYGEWRLPGTIVKFSDARFLEIDETKLTHLP